MDSSAQRDGQTITNGAESMLATLLAGGVDVCFANPGTSEIHFVAALDRFEGMRCLLGLHESVVVGCADGYGRMAGRPAATMLHLGPGLANGLSNLHNARRAGTGIVNLVGEHATTHLHLDAPLNSDIRAIAAPFTQWSKTAADASSLAQDTAEAMAAARSLGGQIATLIVPADAAWGPAHRGGAPLKSIPLDGVQETAVDHAARVLRSGEPTAILLTGGALRDEPLRLASRIAKKTGAKLFAQAFNARMERGAGRPPIESLPFVAASAMTVLAPYRHLILVGSKAPVAFFAHPGRPSVLTHPHCEIHVLATPREDGPEALSALAGALNAGGSVDITPRVALRSPRGTITPQSLGEAIAAAIPENAIVVDESLTSGRSLLALTAHAAPHDLLQNLGGSIGVGLSLATGAAIACPDRKVLCLESDGSGLYAPQALWTQARESLNVTTLIFSNRAYAVLKHELHNMGVNNAARASAVLELDRPPIDWVGLARSFGVPAERVETIEDVHAALIRAMHTDGPALIEALF
ncbi:MAG: acetolactate synthase large subunit [Hyphomicrobiales bacterium]|nr:acetolactate synthase large subunit [Hyphomicrobiales bacterium]